MSKVSKFLDLSLFPWVAIDVEATGLRWWKDKAFGVSIAVPAQQGLPNGASFYYDLRDEEEARYVRDMVPRARLLVAHHAKYDVHMTREAGIKTDPAKWRCTMIREALIDEHRISYDLDALGRSYFGRTKEDIWPALAELFGGRPTKNAQIQNLVNAPRDLVGKYAVVDAELSRDIYEAQEVKLEQEDLQKVHDLEFRLFPHIVRMEYHGVGVDLDYAETLSKRLAVEIKKAQAELDRMAGFKVNVNPSGSLAKLIGAKQDKDGQWIAKDGTPIPTTDGGKPSMSADTLRMLKMPEAAKVLEVRQLRKLKETFIDGHVLGHHHEGVIHATINQTKNDADRGTGTGRFSIQDPALQQIHKRNRKLAAMVRPCFIPDPGQVWECRDWSQMDFRIFAHYANDPAIINLYRENPDADFHQTVADLTGLPRDRQASGGGNAKQVNLGLVFGMSAGRMALEMGLPCYKRKGRNGKIYLEPGEEAEEIFRKYHSTIPGISRLLENASSVAKSRGYVRTAMGRRIRFPGGRGLHKAGGLIFQGTAADALKVKMCELCEYFETQDARLMLVVHDEFNSSLPPGNEQIRKEVKRIVESFGPDDAIPLRVPIRSSAGVGDNWWTASS